MLTAALALVALPGLAGSRAPSPIEPVPAGAFQQLTIPADDSRSTASIGALDDAYVSAGADRRSRPSIVEPGAATSDAATRPPDGRSAEGRRILGPQGRPVLGDALPGARASTR